MPADTAPSLPRDLDCSASWLATGALIAAAGLFGFGIILWIAANWDGLGKWGRFAIVFAALAACSLAAMTFSRARAAFALASLMSIGGLLALIGQTYQTGADPWQLFALWAALALPLALAARNDAVWAAWIVVAFTALGLWLEVEMSVNLIQPPATVLPAWLVAFAMTAALSPFSMLERWTGHTRWAFRLAAVLTSLLILTTTLPAILDKSGSDTLVAAGFAVTALAIAAILATRPLDLGLLAVFVLTLDVLVLSVIAYALFMNGNMRSESMSLLAMGLISMLVVAASAAAIMAYVKRSPINEPLEVATHGRESGARSWPVVVLTGIGALFAAVPFIGFLAVSYGMFLDKGPGAYIFGGGALAIALFLMRAKSELGFAQQFGIIAFITGLILLCFGLYSDLPELAASLTLLALMIAIAALLPNRWTVGLMGFFAGGFGSVALNSLINARASHAAFDAVLTGHGWSYAAAAAALMLVLVHERAASREAASHESTILRFLTGWLAATLLFIIYQSGETFMLGGRMSGWQPHAPALARPFFSLDVHSLIALVMTAAGCALIARARPELKTPTGITTAVLLLVLTLAVPGMGAPALAAAAAIVTGRRALALLACFALLWLVGTFYYWLGWPLTHKAYLMIALGATLGAVASLSKADLSTLIPADPRPVSLGGAAAPVLVLLSFLATSVLAAQAIRQKEALIETGRSIYVPLAPVDPRSLMQGDYMALRFDLPSELPPPEVAGDPPVRAIATVDAKGIAKITALAGASYKPSGEEIIVNLARKRGRWMFATDAWYFKEGSADTYAKARFGEFRVSSEGDALLVGLADENLQALK